MDLGLAGRRYLVAGASSGLGAEVSQVLLEERASVLGVARSLAPCTPNLPVERDSQFMWLSADLATSAGSDSLQSALAQLQPLDGMIVTIGSGSSALGPRHERFDSAVALNVMPVLRTLDAALNFIKIAEESSVVLVSSIAGTEWIQCPPEYAAAKAALTAYSSHMARELSPLRFNTLAPGNMLTSKSVWSKRYMEDPKALKEYLDTEVPLGRLARPREVAMLAAYLLSPASSFVSGATLTVDGGQTRSW